jgi:hypothetical protein
MENNPSAITHLPHLLFFLGSGTKRVVEGRPPKKTVAMTTAIDGIFRHWEIQKIDRYLEVIVGLLEYVWNDPYWKFIEKKELFQFAVIKDAKRIDMLEYLRILLRCENPTEFIREKRVAFFICLNYSLMVKILAFSNNDINDKMGCCGNPTNRNRIKNFNVALNALTKKLEGGHYANQEEAYLYDILCIWTTGIST